MKIAMVSEHASPLAVLGGADAGGQNVYLAALTQHLGRRGHQVVVHTRRDSTGTPRRVEFVDGVVVDHVTAGPRRRIPKDRIWDHIDAFAEDLRGQWLRDTPDIVHAHFWMSGIASVRAAASLGVPVAVTFHALGVVKRRHQGAADSSPAARIAAEQDLIDTCDRIIATCTDEAFELRQLGAGQDQVSIVPCGVNLDNFTPSGEAAARDPRWTHRVVAVSRLVPRKGIDDIIRALAAVPDTELVVAGGPRAEVMDADPEVRRLRAVAECSGVADRVVFVGSLGRSEVSALLRSADALVTVPWYEPFGIVPLEAMATGTPVIATAVGGMVDTVVHEVTGLHVPPRDPEALAGAMRQLLADPVRCAELGAAGVRRARGRYSWHRVADGVEQAYRTTIADARGTALRTAGSRHVPSQGWRSQGWLA